MPKQILSRYANIRGIGVRVRADDIDVIEHFTHDFHYFLQPTGPVSLEIILGDLKLGQQNWREVWRTKQSVIFRSPRGEKRVCFFSKSWVRYRYRDGLCLISGRESSRLYEALYFVVLSHVGEQLDQKGKHRIHGLGLANQEKSTLVLAPAGGGKSTLLQSLLGDKEVGLLSDDTPIVSTEGGVEAFPQRIALREKPLIAERYVRSFDRFFYGRKYVVGSEYFQAQVRDRSEPGKLVLLQKTSELNLRPRPKWRAIWPLLKWLVIGCEVPQIWELYLRVSGEDLSSKVKILMSRLRTAVRLLRSVQFYELRTGPDPKVTATALKQLVMEPIA